MAIKTTIEQLEEVQTAISKVLRGQACTINGKSVTRADLDVLHKREEVLLSRYKAEQGTGGPVIVHGIIRRG
jgi:hypothetical protein